MVNSEVAKYVDENKKLQQELVQLFFSGEINNFLPVIFTLFQHKPSCFSATFYGFLRSFILKNMFLSYSRKQ
jgi:hypothetical protein